MKTALKVAVSNRLFCSLRNPCTLQSPNCLLLQLLLANLSKRPEILGSKRSISPHHAYINKNASLPFCCPLNGTQGELFLLPPTFWEGAQVTTFLPKPWLSGVCSPLILADVLLAPRVAGCLSVLPSWHTPNIKCQESSYCLQLCIAQCTCPSCQLCPVLLPPATGAALLCFKAPCPLLLR